MANFISKVNKNLYSNQYFYKIINYSNTKLIHNGINLDNSSDEIDKINTNYQNTIPLEISLQNKEPIYGIPIFDPKDLKNLKNKFEKGSIAMVNAGKNSSSSTEFFFTLNTSPEFDGRYSIFGKVIRGLEILESLEKNDYIKNIKLTSKSQN